MTDNGHISQEDLAFYAMQSLSADQTAAVRAHLAGCALCRSELAGISGDLALVGLSVSQQALPEGARQRFLDKLAAEPVAGATGVLRPWSLSLRPFPGAVALPSGLPGSPRLPWPVWRSPWRFKIML